MANLKAKKDFTEGPLFGRMFLYSVPIILSGLLQMCYNIADHVVLGKFSGDATALAAVGSTASLSNLIIGFLLGIAGGTAVVVAQFYGARRNDQVSLAVHTSITVSIIGGIAVMLIALVAAEPLLLLMNTKEDIIDQAILYLMITAIGFPALSIMNFGAGIIRSTGDSKTPLIIFSLSGIINVLFNLFFVTVFHMNVAGVALATASVTGSVNFVITPAKEISRKMPSTMTMAQMVVLFKFGISTKIIRLTNRIAVLILPVSNAPVSILPLRIVKIPAISWKLSFSTNRPTTIHRGRY
jgi:Na+-driven multidrug efflux pump